MNDTTQHNAQTAIAKTKPWMAALLLKDRQLFKRFTAFYRRLAALPRRTRRSLQRKTALTLASTAFMLSLGRAPIIHAASTITVTSGAAGISADGQCSLAEAIINANDDAATHVDCSAGSGSDTILLSGNTYSYSAALSTDGNSALPDITTEITIEANGSTIERTSGSPDFRIMSLTSSSSFLRLNDATLSGGNTTLDGGAITVSHSDATLNIQNGYFYDNTGSSGGGIYSQGNLTVNNSLFSSNNSPSGRGGAISSYANNGVTIKKSTFSGNHGHNAGGAIFNYGTMTISDCTISGNTVNNDGGGISNGGNLYINNSTVSNNTGATYGGGMVNFGNATITNSTITDNAGTNGSGVFNFGTTTITTSVISGNNGGNEEVASFSTSGMTSNYNLFGHSGKSNSIAFFNFVPSANDITATSDGTNPTALTAIMETSLANNGGPTLTHALVSGSPAIDAISTATALCTAGDPDQRNAPRANGVNQGGTACDIGAYEYDSSPQMTAVTLQTLSIESETIRPLVAFSSLLFTATTAWVARRKQR